jgi:hypothetical protein
MSYFVRIQRARCGNASALSEKEAGNGGKQPCNEKEHLGTRMAIACRNEQLGTKALRGIEWKLRHCLNAFRVSLPQLESDFSQG